jgi:hypothetical protein
MKVLQSWIVISMISLGKIMHFYKYNLLAILYCTKTWLPSCHLPNQKPNHSTNENMTLRKQKEKVENQTMQGV